MPHEDADVSDLSAAQLARLRDALRGAAPPDNEPLPRSQFPDVQNTIAQTRSSADARGAASGPSAAERIGGYTLVRKLGEGGMGVVYLAQQENPRRDVALKVVRPGFLTPEFQRRFEYEAHVLGQLQHPGIAQIFEAGTAHTAAGPQPYFAMEYVRGELLLAYAARAGLNVRERLGLLVLICEAVQHAHQKGIVHRDLKPANILVTDSSLATDAQAGPDFAAADHRASSGLVRRSGLEGAAVQPKILDFGLARTLGTDVQALTLHTSAGQLLGTLPYMSPEQTGGDPNAVDTRSDVYALGLVGYELLTGRLPYEVRGKPILEALRTIRDAEPLRPAAVDRSLRGDVETILLKALEKERSRRYPSASELAADIRRFLRDEPIAARPASAFYQLSKFARRHRALVFAAGAAAVALVLGLAATTWQMSRARQAEARATQRFEQVRKLARTFLFDVSDQVQALQGSRQTVEFIVRTAREYVEDLLAEAADDAELMNDLLGAMIRVGDLQGNPNQANLGDLQAALASYRQAADALERSGLHAGGDRRSVRQLSVAYSRIADVLEVQGEAAAAAEH
ncbi:MAG: serine/threonine protein kinase, partial [Phycisphaerae bacterium]